MRPKILLVDDNRDLLEDFPVWFPEYEISAAASAEAALALLEKPDSFDLVIMDVYLPGMDGLKALEKIKQAAPLKPVIIMTGYSTKDVALHALAARADSYLEKPFGLAAARATIEKELARSGGCGRPEDMSMSARIDKVRGFIEGNWSKKITLKDAAESVFMTPKYLSKVFRELTGVGFSEYKLRVKMTQACRMLASSGLSVKQISSRLGYANAESFIRQFEKLKGKAPSAYRSGRQRLARRPG